MRGRKPKPTALKLLTGNPGGRRLPEDEPRPELARPERPAYLDAGAVAEWERIVPELEAIGLLTRVDSHSLAGYCRAVSRLAAAEAIIAEEGMTQFTVEGGVKKRPEVMISKECSEEIRKYSALFGLSPADRSRIHVAKKAPKDARAEKAKRFFGT